MPSSSAPTNTTSDDKNATKKPHQKITVGNDDHQLRHHQKGVASPTSRRRVAFAEGPSIVVESRQHLDDDDNDDEHKNKNNGDDGDDDLVRDHRNNNEGSGGGNNIKVDHHNDHTTTTAENKRKRNPFISSNNNRTSNSFLPSISRQEKIEKQREIFRHHQRLNNDKRKNNINNHGAHDNDNDQHHHHSADDAGRIVSMMITHNYFGNNKKHSSLLVGKEAGSAPAVLYHPQDDEGNNNNVNDDSLNHHHHHNDEKTQSHPHTHNQHQTASATKNAAKTIGRAEEQRQRQKLFDFHPHAKKVDGIVRSVTEKIRHLVDSNRADDSLRLDDQLIFDINSNNNNNKNGNNKNDQKNNNNDDKNTSTTGGSTQKKTNNTNKSDLTAPALISNNKESIDASTLVEKQPNNSKKEKITPNSDDKNDEKNDQLQQPNTDTSKKNTNNNGIQQHSPSIFEKKFVMQSSDMTTYAQLKKLSSGSFGSTALVRWICSDFSSQGSKASSAVEQQQANALNGDNKHNKSKSSVDKNNMVNDDDDDDDQEDETHLPDDFESVRIRREKLNKKRQQQEEEAAKKLQKQEKPPASVSGLACTTPLVELTVLRKIAQQQGLRITEDENAFFSLPNSNDTTTTTSNNTSELSTNSSSKNQQQQQNASSKYVIVRIPRDQVFVCKSEKIPDKINKFGIGGRYDKEKDELVTSDDDDDDDKNNNKKHEFKQNVVEHIDINNKNNKTAQPVDNNNNNNATSAVDRKGLSSDESLIMASHGDVQRLAELKKAKQEAAEKEAAMKKQQQQQEKENNKKKKEKKKSGGGEEHESQKHLQASQRGGTSVDSERQILQNCAHPNIVGYVDDFAEEGFHHTIMEYVDGGDLDEFLKKVKTNQFGKQQQQVPPSNNRIIGRNNNNNNTNHATSSRYPNQHQQQQQKTQPAANLSEKFILFLFVQTLLAIEYLHRHNILHRDLKSANLILSKKFIVKLVDFGLSKQFNKDVDKDVSLTALGTPLYAAPELCLGESYSQEADLWSVNCILFELITLRKPFEGSSVRNLLQNIVHAEPRKIHRNDISGELRSIVANLFQKDPRKRYSAKEILRLPIMQKALSHYITRFGSLVHSEGTAIDRIWERVLIEHQQLILNEEDATKSSCKSRASMQRSRREAVQQRIFNTDELGSAGTHHGGSTAGFLASAHSKNMIRKIDEQERMNGENVIYDFSDLKAHRKRRFGKATPNNNNNNNHNELVTSGAENNNVSIDDLHPSNGNNSNSRSKNGGGADLSFEAAKNEYMDDGYEYTEEEVEHFLGKEVDILDDKIFLDK